MNAPRWVFWVALALGLIMANFIGWYAMTHRRDEGMISMSVTMPDGRKTCPIRWPVASVPVPVTVELASADDLAKVTEAAVQFWNGVVGRKVLSYAGTAQVTDGLFGVVVTAHYDEQKFERAETMGAMRPHFDALCTLRRADVAIKTDPTQSMSQRQRAVDHELGHALGLGHDDTELRVMHPDLNWVGDRISDAGRAALRAAYPAP